MQQPLLQIKKLELAFQTDQGLLPILNNVNFSIDPGQTFALVGESGSGKSITALAIMQLLPAAARVAANSEILFADQDLLSCSEIAMRKVRGRRIGIIFQEAMTALNAVLTIGQQIDEVLRCHFRLNKAKRKLRIIDLLQDVGIKDPNYCAQCYPHQLSGGMRQRAMIAMVLAAEPDLLIADEPTTALDVTLQDQILRLLKKIQNKTDMSLLFITHDLAVVSQVADYLAVLHCGKIVEQATTKTFFHKPKHPYSQQLLAAIPDWQKPTWQVTSAELEQKPILNVENLKVHFPIRKGILKRTVGYIKAVDDVSLSINKGQTLALVGESGSGKTTTGRAILQLVKPSAGNVQFNAIELTTLRAHKMRKMRGQLQIIFQDPCSSLNPRMLVKDIIEEGMLTQHIGKSRSKRLQRIDELLHMVGLEPKFKLRYPHEFSGGQRQRICIARTLAVEPELIICDEPTSALDVSVQMQILQLLEKLQKELGLSYLLITHNLGVVAYLAHQVAVMHNGKIVESGHVQQILHNPQHAYTQSLLNSVPIIKTKESG